MSHLDVTVDRPRICDTHLTLEMTLLCHHKLKTGIERVQACTR